MFVLGLSPDAPDMATAGHGRLGATHAVKAPVLFGRADAVIPKGDQAIRPVLQPRRLLGRGMEPIAPRLVESDFLHDPWIKALLRSL